MAGTVRENMGTRSMLPTQMTIMPRNQLSLSINKGLVLENSQGFLLCIFGHVVVKEEKAEW